MVHGTRTPRPDKPEKPYPGFPLFPHATGRWCKKIRGRFHYFGPWDDPDGALERYLDQRDDLMAGRKPRESRECVTIGDACNLFLDTKNEKVRNGELAAVSWRGYKLAAKVTLEVFDRDRAVSDLGPADFSLLRRHVNQKNGLVGQKNAITRIRMIFRHAYEAGMISRPLRFGPDFSRPAAKAIRSRRTPKMFERDEIQTMLDKADCELRCMLLLGVNAGFGPSDLSKLPWAVIDLKNGWCDFPRPKTATHRHIPLWAETVRALRELPREKGQVYVFRLPPKAEASDRSGDWLCDRFRNFLRRVGLYQRQRGIYGLRHAFETIAGESRDQVAVDAIMGHENGHMSGHYRERISDERLQTVADTVKTWLFDPPAGNAEPDEAGSPDVIRFPGKGGAA